MRIVRVKLESDVSDLLKTYCVRFRFNDLFFVEDLYALALTKGGGLPDDARLDKLCTAYAKINDMPKIVVKTILAKRRQLLRSLASNPLFLLETKRKTHPRIITERLLEFYFNLYRRVRQSQCMTCQYLSSCAFGQSYGSAVTTIHAVVDPDYSTKAHPDCPERPTMEGISQLSTAQNQLDDLADNPSQLAALQDDPNAQQMSQQLPKAMDAAADAQSTKPADGDEDAMPCSLEDAWEDEIESNGLEDLTSNPPGASTGAYSTTFSAPAINIDMAAINKIKMHNFLIFELARKLSSKLGKAHEGKFRPSTELTSRQKTKNIKSIGDVSKVLPREHAQDDDVFDRKLQNRQLNMRESEKKDPKRHLLYILLDTSESMTSCVSRNTPLWTVVSRALLSVSFSLALVDLIEKEGGILFMRGFDGAVSSLYSARDPAEFEALRRYLVRCAFNGDSTDITGALRQAIYDINAAKDELKDAEILLITDCGATITKGEVTSLKDALKTTVLNVMDVASTSTGIELIAGQALRQLSDHYFKVTGSAGTLDQLVTLVGGQKALSNKTK